MITDVLFLLLLTALMAFGALYLAQDRLDPLAVFSYLYFPRFVMRPGFILLGLDPPAHPFLFVESPQDLAREALLIFTVAYLAYAAGYLFGKGPTARWLGSFLPGFASPGIDARRLRLVVLIGLVTSVAVVGLFLRNAGSAADFMYESRHGLWAGFAFLQRLPLVTSFAAGLLVFWSLEQKSRLTTSLLIFAVCLVVMFMMGDRGAVIYALFVVVVTYHLSLRRIPAHVFATAGLGLAALVLMLGTLRDATFASRQTDIWTALDDAQRTTDSNWAHSVSEYLNLSSIDHFLVIVQDFDSTNYHYGDDFLQGFVGIIPRSLWPDKPEAINLGIWFRDTYMPGKSGKPITAIGGWWLNFGYLGVVLGLALSGFLGRVIWDYVRGSGYRAWAVLFYIIVFFNVTSWGVLTTVTPMAVILWVIPFLIIFKLVLTRPQAVAASPPASVPPLGNLRRLPVPAPERRESA